MLPTVAEIVLVGHRVLLGPQNLVQTNALLVDASSPELRVRSPVERSPYGELVKMRVSPADRDLQHIVQLLQRKRARHQQPPPYWRSDAIQRYLDLIHQRITCYSSVS